MDGARRRARAPVWPSRRRCSPGGAVHGWGRCFPCLAGRAASRRWCFFLAVLGCSREPSPPRGGPGAGCRGRSARRRSQPLVSTAARTAGDLAARRRAGVMGGKGARRRRRSAEPGDASTRGESKIKPAPPTPSPAGFGFSCLPSLVLQPEAACGEQQGRLAASPPSPALAAVATLVLALVTGGLPLVLLDGVCVRARRWAANGSGKVHSFPYFFLSLAVNWLHSGASADAMACWRLHLGLLRRAATRPWL